MERCTRIRILIAVCAAATLCSSAWAKYGGGSGIATDPYLIYTPEQMDAMALDWRDWDKCFKLMADLDMSGYAGNQFHIIGMNWQGGFSGVFDGNGKTISHFTYACVDANCIGLFGWVTDQGRVENLGLIDPNICAVRGYYVGALAGQFDGSATNCYVTNACISGKHHVGGLFGSVGKATRCHAVGVVTGVHNVGGLAGYLWDAVTCCSATARVTGSTCVGGLTGWCNGRLGGCFSAGSVVGDTSVGGLAGADDLVISNCYSICDVNGVDQVGGLTGGRAWACTTANCYSAGKVRGKLHTGGLVGMDCAQMVGIPNTIKACFWDMQTSGQPTSDGGTGLPTARMQIAATFLDVHWDFVGETANGSSDLWQMPVRRGYPRLSWEQLPVEEPNVVEPTPALPEDDFDDGQADGQWNVCQSVGDAVHLDEVNGRLEVRSSAPTDEVMAFYLSNGWWLNASEDFALKVSFHFGRRAVGEAKVFAGVTPNAAEPVTRWAMVQAGCSNNMRFCRCEVHDGYAVQDWGTGRSSDDGVLYISYNSLDDELYLSATGYGKTNASQALAGVVKGRWQTDAVHVVLGGSSAGMSLREGDAWLDDFVVESGLVSR